MSDHQTERIRELLDQTAPTDPDLGPADRATAVFRRGRSARRRTRLLGVGAVAVVLAGVIAVPQLLGDDAGTGDAADQGDPAPTAEPCPARPIDVTHAGPVPALGGDLVSVRSCPATWNGASAADPGLAVSPPGTLTGDYAAAFADDIAALPAYQLTDLCAAVMMAPQPWALVVGRPDGEPFVIGSTVTGCGSVQVAGVDRSIESVLAAFAGNLQRQQAGRLTSGQDVATCPADETFSAVDTWNASFDLDTATSGALCFRADPMGSPSSVVREGKLSADQLAAVRDDLVANLTTAPSNDGMCADTGPQRLLVLVDDDGDRTSLVDAVCTGEFTSAHGYWQPSATTEAMFTDVLIADVLEGAN